MARILVVDDDEFSRMYLVAILTRAGHVVEAADNGLQGLRHVATDKLDLIITDIFMPMMDGFELLATILERYPDCKVMAMSGGAPCMREQLALRVAKKFGAMECISKPFRSHEVCEKIDMVLGNHPVTHDRGENNVKTIIVVDDDDTYRFYLAGILRQAGHTVLEATDGAACLTILGKEKVDLIITDIFMPNVDGIDLLATLMRDHPRIRVIAISGGHAVMRSNNILEIAKSFGAREIIAKPFVAETVLKQISKIFQSTGM
ncbi:MAG: response regulator [Magnetococcales bacterium]|nr:response regulator [Magnetococcales bacterium]